MSSARRVVVIGGGIGGLVCAARLAKRGYHVSLFEQNATIGGKMSRASFDGCTFDVGPSLLTMPFVLDDFFREMGTSINDELTLIPIDPACHYRWSDGTQLDLPFNHEAIPDAIGALSPRDRDAVARYITEARFVYEATKDVFIFSPFGGVKEFFRPRNFPLLGALPRLRLTRSLHNVHASTFKDPRVVQLFDRFATYNGSSPYLAPATLMVIPWVEFGFGAWYPMGGMYAIAEAIARVGERVGVEITTSSPVRRIIIDERRTARGVELEDGTIVTADHVVSNADVHITRTRLLGEHLPPTQDLSCSGFVMLCSVEKGAWGLAHHNVLFSDDYQREFADIFERKILPGEPTIYIARSSRTDQSQAAEGRENWFILVNAPSVSGGVASDYAQVVLQRLEAFGIRPDVREMYVRTSADMAREWSTEGGALYGASSNSMFSAFLRPRQRSSQHRNLWYVGGSAHPGGGIPLVTISGSIAADLITYQDQHS
jgi:phytoene desaturase